MPVPNEEYESAFEDASKDSAEEAATQSLSDTGEEYSAERDEETGSAGAAEEETGEEEETPAEEEAGEEEETPAEEETGEEEETPAEEEAGEEEETPAAKQPEKPQGTLDEEQLAAAYRRMRQEDKALEDKGGKGEEQTKAEDPRKKTWRDYVSEEDQKVLEPYESEWSEVSQAEQIKRDAQLQHVQDVVYSDVKAVLAPMVEEFRRLKVEAHFNTIRQSHEDFDEVKEDLGEWVKEQPEFVRPAFEQVLQEGSAKQVVDLVNAYKQAKGKTGAAPEVPASSASKGESKKPARKPPSAGAKRALAATPSTKRKDPPRQADPDDFSSAFDEAAKAVGGI